MAPGIDLVLQKMEFTPRLGRNEAGWGSLRRFRVWAELKK